MFALILLLIPSSWAALVISQSVGLIGKEVVTSREIQMAAVIDDIIGSSGGKDIVVTEARVQEPRFSEEIATYLLETAAVQEAISFKVGEPDEAQVKEILGKVEKATAGKSFWQSLEPDAKTLRKVISTKITAKNFIKIKAESMSSIVTDQEAHSYFEKNRSKFGDSNFDAFKDNIKTFLGQQQKQERLRSWYEVLKKKYKVRNLLLENAKFATKNTEPPTQPAGK